MGALVGAFVASPGATYAAAEATSVDPPRVICRNADCLVASVSAFPSLVVGELVRIDEEQDAQAWWSRVRAQGAWAQLPEDAHEFGQLVRPVTIRTTDLQPSGSSTRLLTVLMTQYEYEGSVMPLGTLVRYAPHGIDHEREPDDVPRLKPYWDITGCVLVLCRAQDAECKSQYLPGIYERGSGRAADWRTGRPTTEHALIDPASRRPLKKIAASSSAASS